MLRRQNQTTSILTTWLPVDSLTPPLHLLSSFMISLTCNDADITCLSMMSSKTLGVPIIHRLISYQIISDHITGSSGLISYTGHGLVKLGGRYNQMLHLEFMPMEVCTAGHQMKGAKSYKHAGSSSAWQSYMCHGRSCS